MSLKLRCGQSLASRQEVLDQVGDASEETAGEQESAGRQAKRHRDHPGNRQEHAGQAAGKQNSSTNPREPHGKGLATLGEVGVLPVSISKPLIRGLLVLVRLPDRQPSKLKFAFLGAGAEFKFPGRCPITDVKLSRLKINLARLQLQDALRNVLKLRGGQLGREVTDQTCDAEIACLTSLYIS